MRSETAVPQNLQEDPPVQSLSPVNSARRRIAQARMLALLWCLVSPGAMFLLWREPEWRRATDVVSGVRAVRLEQWVAVGLMMAHGWFVLQASRRLPPVEAETESHLPPD
jgi:hypothetical protein